MQQSKSQDMISTVVILVLAVLLIGWGWARAHSTQETSAISTGPAGGMKEND